MTNEAYCASLISLLEAEQFLAVGDDGVSRLLNPGYADDRRLGRANPLPDLLSIKNDGGRSCLRLREVKFKLEARLVQRALTQLESGLKWLHQAFTCPYVDRLELVIALRERKLKPAEREFLGEMISPGRYALRFGADRNRHPLIYDREYPVTVLLL